MALQTTTAVNIKSRWDELTKFSFARIRAHVFQNARGDASGRFTVNNQEDVVHSAENIVRVIQPFE